MNLIEIALALFGCVYSIAIIALIIRLIPLVLFDRKWAKAYYLMCSYNHWVTEVLNKPELVVHPGDNLLDLTTTSEIRTMFLSFWNFYTDTDVRISMQRYYKSDNYIDPKTIMNRQKGLVYHEDKDR